MIFTRLLADDLFARGLNEQAADLYRQVLAKAPDDLTVRLRLSETLIRLQEHDETEQLLEGIDPDDPLNRSTVYLLRSILAMPTQTTEAAEDADDASRAEALRWVNLAIQQNGANAGAYARRAMLLYGDERHRASVIDDLNRALELNP